MQLRFKLAPEAGMSGRRAAAIALSLVMDLADRLDAAGVTADNAPTLDEGLNAVWRLAKLEKTAGKAGDSAARAPANWPRSCPASA